MRKTILIKWISLVNVSSIWSMSPIEAQALLYYLLYKLRLTKHSQQQHDSPDVGPSGRNMQSDWGGIGQILIVSRRSLTWKSSVTCVLQHNRHQFQPTGSLQSCSHGIWMCLDLPGSSSLEISHNLHITASPLTAIKKSPLTAKKKWHIFLNSF